MRICIVKNTKHILEMQSNAAVGTLLQNAINSGFSADDVEERVVDASQYEAAKAEDPENLAGQVVAKLVEVKAVRDTKIAAGIPFMFPDGSGTIQTRDLVDSRNIQTNVTMAIMLTMQGVTAAVMTFRDMENFEHAMTPAQMLVMGAYAAQQGQAVYSASWTVERVMAAMTPAQIIAYDVEANWPA
jgi:hypothetical protein